MDKLRHFGAGLALAVIAGFLAPHIGVSLPVWLVALGTAVIAGAFKEWVIDRRLRKQADVSWLDFWATVLGGLVAGAGFVLLG